MSDYAQLETLLYPPPSPAATEQRPIRDWAIVHSELRRPDVTLSLLWEEYRGGTGAQDGFGSPGSVSSTGNGLAA